MWRAQISSIFVGTSYVSHSMVVIYTLGVVLATAAMCMVDFLKLT